MNVTANMGLTQWDLTADPYDHTQLSGDMTLIDGHDHTGGKGKQVPAGGLANNAVTNPAIADSAVTSAKIADGTIDVADLSSAAQMALMPVGAGLLWWRPTAATPVPTGWIIAAGQTLTAGQHQFSGSVGSSITVPDARNTVPLGALDAGGDVTGANTFLAPAIGTQGSANTRNLGHTHSVASHSHVVNAHTHTVASHSHVVNAHSHGVNAHTHGVNAHTHSVSSDGSHKHQWLDDSSIAVDPHQRMTAVPLISGFRQSFYIPNLNFGGDIASDVIAPMLTAGTHTHGGATGAATPSTDSVGGSTDAQSPATTAVAPLTDAQSPGTDSVAQTTGSALTSIDVRPAFTGWLIIMKVKY